MFSPYYNWANRNTPAPAENFCAMNVVLYGPDRWAMTERGAARLQRDATGLRIGPSALTWDGTTLTATIDERCAPLPRRLRGTIRVTPGPMQGQVFTLDPAGRHRWQPIAPCARAALDFDAPALRWQGDAYLDSNDGDVPLARDFRSWHWSRHGGATGATIFYDVEHRAGSRQGLALRVSPDGAAEAFAPPPIRELPPATIWRMNRVTRGDAGAPVTVARTLEDTPFYARALISTSVAGERLTCVHESLSLDRFGQPWVQAMLPFRMPRRG